MRCPPAADAVAVAAAVVPLALACACLCASPAVAHGQPAPTGLQVDVDLVDRTFPLAGQLNLATPVRVGFHWRSFSFLLGVYFVRGALQDEQTGDFPHDLKDSAWWLELAPTVRYHFRPPQAWSLSPFVQVELDWVLVGRDDSGDGDPLESPPTVLGFSAGAGAVFLLTPNFGLSAAVMLRFLHGSRSVDATGGEQTTRVNVLALGGSGGVVIHF